MDVRYSPEQGALRDAAAHVVERLGVRVVADLDDEERRTALAAAVEASGWRELRTPAEGGRPCASAVEVAIVAEELGRGLADVNFLGATLAADLRRVAGARSAAMPETVALSADLAELASSVEGTLSGRAVALDASSCSTALVLVAEGDGFALGAVQLTPRTGGADLTRPTAACPAGSAVAAIDASSRLLSSDAIAASVSLGLATSCADLVGVMRGALTMACDYARSRHQYGAAIGSFQAIQHLLADALVLMEGSRSIALHAAWAVDALPASDALPAAAAAKAYCARAARTVCESVIQVHGGVGNTWECVAHLYLRRALLSSDVLGGVGDSLHRVLAARGVGV
ncbi:MAG TPA: acyl-CoA dehydrogenase [Acidimicrobiales bacterium]|nr:acyl-CoA dehydrogenase [Acidimicrobiales bacterium]